MGCNCSLSKKKKSVPPPKKNLDNPLVIKSCIEAHLFGPTINSLSSSSIGRPNISS